MKKKYIVPEIILQELTYSEVLMLSRTLNVHDRVDETAETEPGQEDYVEEFEDLLSNRGSLWDE